MKRLALVFLCCAFAASTVHAQPTTITAPFQHVRFSFDNSVWDEYHDPLNTRLPTANMTIRGTQTRFSMQESPRPPQANGPASVLDWVDSQLAAGTRVYPSKGLSVLTVPKDWTCRSKQTRQKPDPEMGLQMVCAIVGKDHYDLLMIEVTQKQLDKATIKRVNALIASVMHS